MDNKLKFASILLAVAVVSGCATKHYGREPVVTAGETARLDCNAVAIEIAQTHGFIEQVNKESQFDGRSVLSFLGDFGIGNVMEKEAAMSSARERLASLERVRSQKGCSKVATAQ
ncbi:hypothetical protein ACQKEK_02575 [Pseudomonas sp. NPDC077408]|uniref:hypothetical protein n=1 Tax=Streptomyces parvus TaxID=66428 RepID=UPI003713C688